MYITFSPAVAQPVRDVGSASMTVASSSRATVWNVMAIAARVTRHIAKATIQWATPIYHGRRKAQCRTSPGFWQAANTNNSNDDTRHCHGTRRQHQDATPAAGKAHTADHAAELVGPWAEQHSGVVEQGSRFATTTSAHSTRPSTHRSFSLPLTGPGSTEDRQGCHAPVA